MRQLSERSRHRQRLDWARRAVEWALEARVAEAGLERRRVLVAEDEGMLAWQLVDILEGAGCEVVGPCASVEDLRRLAASGSLDGAVLDVNLRGALVFEVAAELRERGVPIVLSSGYTDAAIFPPEFRDVPRVRKPYEPRALLELCRSVFAPSPTSPQS